LLNLSLYENRLFQEQDAQAVDIVP
jgi:hypothetical protein